MADLERCALAMLRDGELAGWVQERLDARVRHLLIDEFQDTSPLQWHALHAWLSGYAGAGGGASGQRPPGIFIVGDPKQSIYRFRGAEPRVFEAARAVRRAKASTAASWPATTRVATRREVHRGDQRRVRRGAAERRVRRLSPAHDRGRAPTPRLRVDACRAIARDRRAGTAATTNDAPIWRDTPDRCRASSRTSVLREREAATVGAAIAAALAQRRVAPARSSCSAASASRCASSRAALERAHVAASRRSRTPRSLERPRRRT